MKQFLIEYGYGPKIDKWGYYAEKQPPIHRKRCNTLEEALAEAAAIAKAHKKYYVNVFDMHHEFGDPDSDIMLVVGYDKGIAYHNPNYEL